VVPAVVVGRLFSFFKFWEGVGYLQKRGGKDGQNIHFEKEKTGKERGGGLVLGDGVVQCERRKADQRKEGGWI